MACSQIPGSGARGSFLHTDRHSSLLIQKVGMIIIELALLSTAAVMVAVHFVW